ncbi:hypothetical protein Hanom_Chr06g00521091 [Helianthus anomalus]
MANVLVVLSQILRILELTMPRVALARPRAWPCAKASDLVISLVWMWTRAWRVASILLYCIYVGFCCYFASFVHLSSFDPVN